MGAAMLSRRRELLTYAFVSRALSSHDDILLGLTPLFWPIAERLAEQRFSGAAFMEEVQNTYGLPMTAEIADAFIPRLRQAGLLKTESDGYNHRWLRPTSADEGSDEHQQVHGLLNQVKEQFKTFVDQFPTLFTVNLEGDELLDLLFDWQIRNDASLRAAETALETLGAEQIEGGQGDEPSARERFRREYDYLCARFVDHLRVASPETFDGLAQISSALLISEVVLEIRDPSRKIDSLQQLSVYLDGPFVMDNLGVSGRERYDNASYVIGRLQKLGAKLFVFSHSLEEVRGNLQGVFGQPAHLRFGPTADAIRQGALTEDFARAVMHDPETFIERAGMRIVDVHAGVTPTDLRFFDDDNLERFQSALVGWQNEAARRRDAMSVAGVMRHRRGKQSRDVLKLSHVMVSHNSALCRRAHDFCAEEGLISAEQVGPAIHQRTVAAIVWLSVGSSERMQISRQQLIVSCAMALRARPDVIKVMRGKLYEVKPGLGPQFDALMTRARSVQLAMDLTLTSTAILSNANVEEVYELIERSAAERERKEFDKSLRDVREKYTSTIGSKDVELVKLSDENNSIKGQIADLLETERRLFETLVGWSWYIGKAVRVVVWLFTSALVITVIAADVFGLISQLGELPRYILSGLVVLLSAWPLLVGNSRPLKTLTGWAKQFCLKWLVRLVRYDRIRMYADIDWDTGQVTWHGKYDRSPASREGRLL